MPMTPWDSIAGHRCSCGKLATHWYGPYPVCCACHGGYMISEEDTKEAVEQVLNDKIDEWHKSKSTQQLHTYLGLSWEDYSKWVENK
jgi:hypothetical protein